VLLNNGDGVLDLENKSFLVVCQSERAASFRQPEQIRHSSPSGYPTAVSMGLSGSRSCPIGAFAGIVISYHVPSDTKTRLPRDDEGAPLFAVCEPSQAKEHAAASQLLYPKL
jgi:hypothetical protein